MATTPTLLSQDPSLKWNNSLFPLSINNLNQQTSFPSFKNRRSFSKVRVKCFFINNSSENNDSPPHLSVNKNKFIHLEIKENPVEIIAKSIMRTLKAFQKPAAAAVLVGLLLMYDPNSALAASGGRVGGSSFSSRSSMSSSRSYSAPRMGAGSGFSYSVPYYAPSPFSGVYVGPAVGVGSSFFLIMIAFAAFVLVSGFLSEGSESSVLTATEKTSVLKLQVGLLGLGRSLQKDLNWIAESADTSTPVGLHHVLTVIITTGQLKFCVRDNTRFASAP